MLYRRVGDSGLYVSVIGLGEWLTLGGQVDEEGTLRCMKQAYDLGINLFDAAEKYSTGQLEVALGRAIKRFSWKRSRLVISTMINYGAANGETSVNDHTLSRKHVIEATLASLKRLDLEYIDIVRAHRPDKMTPMEETVRAFNYLIENGLAFYWGTSMWSADEIAEACRIAKVFGLAAPIVEQPVYNLLDRQKVDGEFHRLYSKYGMGLVTTSPLKNGVLAADLTPAQPTSRVRFADMADGQHGVSASRPPTHETTAYSRKVERLKPVVDRLGVRVAHLALAWCLKHENVASVLIGASHPGQVVDSVQALRVLSRLTNEVMADIDRAMRNKPVIDSSHRDRDQ
ncbi:hypothetical protein LOZ65_006420 [Ophidiomyces ophidiicola]|nr:hypothetical protein LOZ65_006420 [Ophidiomyces ophidiicola]